MSGTAAVEPDLPKESPALFHGKSTFWLTAAAGTGFDWWSKGAAFAYHSRENGLMAEQHPLELCDMGFVRIAFVREYNAGMAFGWLQDVGHAYLYLGLARAAAIGCMLWLLRRTPSTAKPSQLAFAFLVAGAAGNLLDNMFHLEPLHPHSVRDFLFVSFGGLGIPAFNVADVLVTAGALLFVGALLRVRRA